MIQLNASIERWSKEIYTGEVKEFKGLVVQEKTLEATKRSLLKAIRVKIAFDTGLPIENINEAKKGPCKCPNFIETESPNHYTVEL